MGPQNSDVNSCPPFTWLVFEQADEPSNDWIHKAALPSCWLLCSLQAG